MKLLGYLFTLLLATTPIHAHLKILSTPDGVSGPEPCALTCSGVSLHSETGHYKGWKWAHRKGFKHITDLEECGFKAAPVVTVTLAGPTNESGVRGVKKCPSAYVWSADKAYFNVFTVEETTLQDLNENKCDVYWTATGFNC